MCDALDSLCRLLNIGEFNHRLPVIDLWITAVWRLNITDFEETVVLAVFVVEAQSVVVVPGHFDGLA